jgi:hypothetical protein
VLARGPSVRRIGLYLLRGESYRLGLRGRCDVLGRLQDELGWREEVVVVGRERLVEGLVVLVGGVYEVVDQVASDEGAAVDWVALLVEFRVSGRG